MGGGLGQKIHTRILQIICDVDYAHIPTERNIEIQMEEYLRRDTKTWGKGKYPHRGRAEERVTLGGKGIERDKDR